MLSSGHCTATGTSGQLVYFYDRPALPDPDPQLETATIQVIGRPRVLNESGENRLLQRGRALCRTQALTLTAALEVSIPISTHSSCLRPIPSPALHHMRREATELCPVNC